MDNCMGCGRRDAILDDVYAMCDECVEWLNEARASKRAWLALLNEQPDKAAEHGLTARKEFFNSIADKPAHLESCISGYNMAYRFVDVSLRPLSTWHDGIGKARRNALEN